MNESSYYRRSIDALMAEAGNHEVPSAEEEAVLIRKAKQGNVPATHRLILGHLRLVLKLAHRMGGAWNTDLMEELAAAGITGMMEAVKAYRAEASNRGRFINYAVFHVRRQMRRALSEWRTPVSANPNNYDLARKIVDMDDQSRREGHRLSNDQIGKKLGLTANRVERARKLLESPMYLDHAVGDGEDDRNGYDLCADAGALSPAVATEFASESKLLQGLMQAHLNEREVAILKARFGMCGDGEIEELHVIGERYHLSRERVRQIEAAALKKLRFYLTQTCPTYRERAARASGISSAILPSEMPVRPIAPSKGVEVVASRRLAPKSPRVVGTKAPVRRIVRREAVAA